MKRLHAELNKLPLRGDDLKEYKAELVRQYTNGRETSTTMLYATEADKMIRDLQRIAPPNPEALIADKKRKLIIHYARQMGWETEDGKADMERIDAWARNYGHGHKGLNEYTLTELSRLVWQMERVYKQFLAKVV